MGNQYLDLILFGALAVFLAFRLRSVLGRRSDDDVTPSRPTGSRPGGVGGLPPLLRRGAQPAPPRPGQNPSQGQGLIAPGDSPLLTGPPASGLAHGAGGQVVDLGALRPSDPIAAGLAQIRAADPNFRLDQFLDGARHAFDMIVTAFALGDTATLRLLLGDEVYDAFSQEIRRRMAAGETASTKVVRLADPIVQAAALNGRTASIGIKFQSSQVTVTRAADGTTLDGDPEQPVEHTDYWTFARNTRATDPNWFLVSTETPE